MYLEKLYKLKEYIEKRKESLELNTPLQQNEIIKFLEKEYKVNHDKIFGFNVPTYEMKYLSGFNRYKNTGVLFENEPFTDWLLDAME
jgi:hypothetical protein